MSKTAALHDSSEGRDAKTPLQLPVRAWKEIAARLWSEFNDDRVMLIAAGATFYLLLALFPALAVFVSVYGFVADPVTIADHIAFLGGVLPSGGVDLIKSQLQSLATADKASLSFAFVSGFVVAIWSANGGVKTLFEAMNIAYDETEKRSFIKLNLISLLFTLGAVVIATLFITMVGVVPAVLAFVGLGPVAETLISLARWPILFVAAAAAISILYRYGPSRTHAKWRWVTWGSVAATVVWIVASVLFSWYLTNFADYNATYGSLGAVIGFMMWTWISVTIVIAGAELNSEMEHQTAEDSTVGTEKPLGSRGASMADKVANVADKSGKPEQKAPGAKTDAKTSRESRSRPSGSKGGASRAATETDDEPSAIGTAVAYAFSAAAVANKLFRGR